MENDICRAPAGALQISLGVEWIDGLGKPGDYSSRYACVFNDGLDQLSCDDPNDYLSEDLEPFTPNPQWSPETNTMPLKDLSDEQAAQLFNAWRSGARVEMMDAKSEWAGCSPVWCEKTIYRLRPKSPRDAFIEQFDKFKAHTQFVEVDSDSAGDLYDMCQEWFAANPECLGDIKAPEVE